MDIDRNLEDEMKRDKILIDHLRDNALANEFYSALCNTRWRLIVEKSEDIRIIDKLKGEEPGVWSCSWRYAGGIIAEIRSDHHGVNENYIDFYCLGNEGEVSELVRECFERMGWEPYPW
jgi:hypothetical protein